MSNLIPIEFSNQRVLLTSQLAEYYGTEPQVVVNNFNRNKSRYQAGKHFFCLKGEEKRDFINQTQIDLGLKNSSNLYLWTEKGALLHAKSLNTDKAWEAYDFLVESYFTLKEVKSTFEQLSPQLQALINLETRQNQFDNRLSLIEKKLENTVTEITKDWATSTKEKISAITKREFRHSTSFLNYLYRDLEKVTGVDLALRKTRLRTKLLRQGANTKEVHKVSNINVIELDGKLKNEFERSLSERAEYYV